MEKHDPRKDHTGGVKPAPPSNPLVGEYPDSEINIDTESSDDVTIVTPADTHVAVIKDDPTRPYKAYASTVASFVVAFVGVWIGDEDPFTKKEIAQGLVTALISSGLVGGTTFFVSNPKRAYDA